MKHFKNLFNLLNKLNETYDKAEDAGDAVAGVVAELTALIKEVANAKAARSDIAPTFDDATNYYKNDLVYYTDEHGTGLYEFQTDHTAGDWETSEVIQKDLSDILQSLRTPTT